MMGGNIYWKEKKKQQLLSQNVKRTRKVKKQRHWAKTGGGRGGGELDDN